MGSKGEKIYSSFSLKKKKKKKKVEEKNLESVIAKFYAYLASPPKYNLQACEIPRENM